jgi:hypothetical protein
MLRRGGEEKRDLLRIEDIDPDLDDGRPLHAAPLAIPRVVVNVRVSPRWLRRRGRRD